MSCSRLTRILSKALFLWTETLEEIDLTWVFQYYIFAATHNRCQETIITKQVVQFNFCHFLVVIRAAAEFKLMGSRAARESSSTQWKYHIFLSFRGEDTRKGFTSHLHKALESREYDVFMDEDVLQVGQVIKPELLQAIEKSKISVIVFSKRYADSSWCLNELVKIMECRRTLNQIVLPIFYNVDPSDVRHQTGTLASDFQTHTTRHKDEVVKEWRKALTEASNLKAEVLKDTADRNEAEFIEAFIENNIVGRLSTTPLPVADYPVGVDSRVHDMISYLLGGGSQDVVIIGIWGMGGLGKTTAAKAIYNRIKDKFDAHGFLGDIRDTANRHGLVYLQKLLLAEIYKKPTKFHISCVDGGMGMIKKELGCKRVLVIIDDVDEKEQLEAIVGNRDWFGSGSRIIITTRDKHFLEELHVDKTFTVPEMNPDEGLELFCRHAFQKGYPNEQYLELSEKVVSYSGGLPLALKVLGSFLIGRTIAEWESQLEELEGIPPKGILKKLRISYDGLDDKEKCIFLDISCFFIGMNKDHVRKILDGCGFKAEIKISVLLQKCLVTVNEKNQLMMHDLLRDMGRAICQGDRSRLWGSPEDVADVLEDKSGAKKVERLALNLRSSEKASFGSAFSKMRKLKLLQLNNAELTEEYKILFKNLRWLCWHGFLRDSIPGNFDLTSLVAMDLQFSKLKIVWKDCKLQQNLKILNLSHSHRLTKSPDFLKLPNLEELILQSCWSLSEVHSSIGDLGKLSLVNLEDCEMLKDLPLNFYKSKSIETLLLNGCRSFEKLAEDLGDMVSLTTLKADYTAIRQIPFSILKLKKLKVFSLFNVRLTDDASTNLLPRLKVLKVLSNHLDIEKSGSKDVVRVIGIWGMGGIGKTTLAKAIYNKFEGSFEGRSFLANVREVIAHQPIPGLVGLQEQLLNDILKSRDPIKVDSVAKGIDMIRARLCCKRALVIIDDADDLQQLNAVAGARDWFGPGSRIVITTRNQHLLDQVGVDRTYMAPAMDEEEALELFSWHAFKRGYPDQEYLDLSKRVIRYCQGLPLALEVVGSFLSKRSIAEWENHLQKLEISLDGDIQKILRISFDGLPDDTTRKIFLDISHFFIGMDKDYVTQILNGCGFFATIGIMVLVERCLVIVSEQNKLMMHDLLRDMGREIIRENARGFPGKFSGLWQREDLIDVLNDESGTEEIEGVALDLHLDSFRPWHQDLDVDLTTFSARAFTKMKKLRILRLSNVELTGQYKDFPKKLICLSWHGFPLNSIPYDFPMQPRLVALDLQYSKLKIVWEDCKLHWNLRILNLSHSHWLTKSPDFSKLPNLEELILQSCLSLCEVHSSIGHLGRLSLVNLEGCHMLTNLPLNFYKSKSIETLILDGCSSFHYLADGLGDMVSLTILKADKTGIRQIPSSIVKLKKLRILSLSGCRLTEDAIHKDLCSLISLEDLLLGGNDFCSLPSLAGLSKLKVLCLNACRKLLAIPDLPTNLYVLKAIDCPELETIPDFSKMSNMRELYLSDSFKLTEFQAWISQ